MTFYFKFFVLAMCMSMYHGFSPLRGRPILAKQNVRFTEVKSANVNQLKYNFLQATTSDLVGEDAAVFELEKQSLKSWGIFAAAVSAVLGSLFYIWVYDDGLQLGNKFKDTMETFAGGDSTLTEVYILAFFAIVHSGINSMLMDIFFQTPIYIIYI